MSEVGQVAFWGAAAIFGVGFWVAVAPLIRAFADRIRGQGSAEHDARIAALEARSPITGETDAVHQRVLELEERLDFTERLLAQARPPEGARPKGTER